MNRDDALNIFKTVAAQHGRKIVVDSNSEHSIQCRISADDGLLYNLYFAWFLEGEVVISTDAFTMEFFHGGKYDVSNDFQSITDEILSNKVRMYFYTRKNAKNPYKVKLQRKENRVWSTFFTYYSGWPWALSPKQEPKFFFDSETRAPLP